MGLYNFLCSVHVGICIALGGKMDRKILIVDFDKTLGNTGEYPGLLPPKWIHKLVMMYVKYKHKKGWFIILNTCREGGYLVSALNYLEEYYNFQPLLANRNASWLINKYGDCRKISGDLIIDDRQVGLIGFLLRRFG